VKPPVFFSIVGPYHTQNVKNLENKTAVLFSRFRKISVLRNILLVSCFIFSVSGTSWIVTPKKTFPWKLWSILFSTERLLGCYGKKGAHLKLTQLGAAIDNALENLDSQKLGDSSLGREAATLLQRRMAKKSGCFGQNQCVI
jgi:hypothetical protein